MDTQKKTKQDIIADLAKNKAIETIISNVTKCHRPEHEDLAQMLYLDLLSKPDDLIQELDARNSLQYFLARMVTNSINSKTSRFYYLFGKYNSLASDIDEYREEDTDD